MVYKRTKVVVRVPATTANLGPGFDAIGMAVDIWNEISVERSEEFAIFTEGEGTGRVPEEVDPKTGASQHSVMIALARAFDYAGETPMPPVIVRCRNRVPVCSGFGSSSAAIVGGLVAGLVLAGKEMKCSFNANGSALDAPPEELLQLATLMEGHPDNVAPAIYGGIQLCVQLPQSPGSKQLVLSRRVPVPDGLRIVAYVPSEDARFSFSADKTEQMRGLLDPMVPRADAVFNIQRTALMIDALHRGEVFMLGLGCEDALHQPKRGERAFPHLYPMIAAARAAGAHGAFLSGAGPTVMAICSGAVGDIFTQAKEERQELKVAEAMKQAAETMGPEHAKWATNGQFFIVSPTHHGAHVMAAEPKFSDGLKTFGSLDGSM